MIDDAQYQHVLANGCLPGGTVVSNSPIAAAEQADWNKLASEEVISADELAAMLFDGDIPGLTEEEEQAFIELAPVYQPKRSKRLTYDVRRKHARVKMIRQAHYLRTKREEFQERVKQLDIPLVRGEGILMSIGDDGIPFYSESSGMGSCDTISCDEVWGTNRVNAAGQLNTDFNLTGAGVTLAMWEWGGVNEYHMEFVDRVVDKTRKPTWSHANAVAEVMVGAGVNTNAQGAAPAAKLHAYSRRDSNLPTLLYNVATNGLINFSNHSYQTHTTNGHGEYITISFADPEGWDDKRDEIVYESYWHLPVWAVGNDRDDVDREYDTLNAGIAKNVLGVGAIEELMGGYSEASNVVMTTYSGWGPTDDGRIKPDLVAGEYAGWAPKDSGTTAYDETTVYKGTSFAAPAITGSLALLQELHERLFGTNGVPLLASTYKALLIHTADEAGNAPGPDYRFGWGVANTFSAASLMAENALWNSKPFIKELFLPNGEYVSFPVEADTNQSLRITICWSDPPYTNLTGSSGPIAQTLVNDLDLRIIGPTGTNFPWVLNPHFDEQTDHRRDPATTGDNTRDNVEQVVVTNTLAGTYTVLITHKGTLLNNKVQEDGQEVSIILSGTVPENIDPGTAFSITTNGFPRLEITSVVGSVYEISRSTDLRFSNYWEVATNSPLSILHPPTEWIDPAGSTNATQFYKVKQTK